jgi:hypothetical protein
MPKTYLEFDDLCKFLYKLFLNNILINLDNVVFPDSYRKFYKKKKPTEADNYPAYDNGYKLNKKTPDRGRITFTFNLDCRDYVFNPLKYNIFNEVNNNAITTNLLLSNSSSNLNIMNKNSVNNNLSNNNFINSDNNHGSYFNNLNNSIPHSVSNSSISAMSSVRNSDNFRHVQSTRVSSVSNGGNINNSNTNNEYFSLLQKRNSKNNIINNTNTNNSIREFAKPLSVR